MAVDVKINTVETDLTVTGNQGTLTPGEKAALIAEIKAQLKAERMLEEQRERDRAPGRRR